MLIVGKTTFWTMYSQGI